jgi:hypothetical protein
VGQHDQGEFDHHAAPPKSWQIPKPLKDTGQRSGVIPCIDVIIILNGRPDGAEAFDFGQVKKNGFYVADGETESIPGTVNKFTLTLEFWSHGSTHQPWNPGPMERELWI